MRAQAACDAATPLQRVTPALPAVSEGECSSSPEGVYEDDGDSQAGSSSSDAGAAAAGGSAAATPLPLALSPESSGVWKVQENTLYFFEQ